MAIGGGLVVGILIVLYLPWIQGLTTFGPVLYWITGPHLQNYWPEPVLMSLAAWTNGLFGLSWGDVWGPLLAGFKILARLVLVASILWEMRRARGLPDVLIGSARVWIVFLLLVNTWIMPWYYLWPLALCAALGWSSPMVRVCAGLTLTAPIVMYGAQLNYAPVGEWAGLTLILPALLAVAPLLVARGRNAIRTRRSANSTESAAIV